MAMLQCTTVWRTHGEVVVSILVIYLTLYIFCRDPDETIMCPIEFELDDGPAIEEIVSAYPHGVTISDLPHSSEELDDKLDIARSLFREGFLIVVDEATKPIEEGGSDDDDCPF